MHLGSLKDKSKHLKDMVLMISCPMLSKQHKEVDLFKPTTSHEPITYVEFDNWTMAMNEEMKSFQKNKTWDLTKLLEGKRVAGCKKDFKKKTGLSSTEVIMYKIRLVAKGYSQKESVDCNGIFSLVARHTSIHVSLALVVTLEIKLEQLDMKTKFLHGKLEKDILMKQLEGFEVLRKEDSICRLKRSLYELKQSPRQWYMRFNQLIVSHGYCRSNYVEDMLIASRDKYEIQKLKSLLNSEFEIKDIGEAEKILGMEI